MSVGLIAVLVAVFAGAIAQRIAGLGFALLVAPFLVMLLGAHEGVIVVLVCGLVSSTIIMARVWAEVEWSSLWWLAVPAAVATIPAAFVARWLPPAPLSIVVSLLVLVALLVSLLLQRTTLAIRGRLPMGLAGVMSGATNALAGVGGPAVSAYAVMSRWPQRGFAATLQPYFVLTNIVALTVKFAVDPAQSPSFGVAIWLAIVALIVAGVVVGDRCQRYVRDHHARMALIVMSFIGAVAALAKGLADL
ncbi:sulfite exporter TauE/SafE family protein [Aeromicrobium sp. YIM 150415]|uniref:sulfite exporter TauE/SafE family protein n=1 Tax=Aeromicrobium sp. YIM 150415 TaxID=2803912 RepID=UPI001966B2CB|nr:sulfite exporter TauE/SafE family protein [Aeromicrobium sp. YIM 150415]MBM9462418.1 sulfite exporter TauE/SafE family protein [Aeromicrobium sp. YIM 150415]